jgi:hypothetical protein
MAYIGATPTVGNFQVCDAISVVNGQAAYTLQVGGVNVTPESANHMLVSLNGILQKPGSSFTISGSTMTFASNLATGDVIDFVQILGNVLDIGQPSDDTVTAAKLNNDIISGQTALTSTPDDTDELLISDAGTIKRIDYSLIKSTAGLTKLSTTTLSSATTLITFDNSIITSTYDAYYFTILMSPETDNAYGQVRLSDGGSFNSGSSDYGWAYINDSGSGTNSNGAAEIRLFDATDSNIANAYQGELTLLYPSNSSTKTVINYKGHRNDGDPALMNGGGQRLNAEATDGIQFFFSSGDISSGSSITCYGITK